MEVVERVSEAPPITAEREFQWLEYHSAKYREGLERAELFEWVLGTVFAGEPLYS